MCAALAKAPVPSSRLLLVSAAQRPVVLDLDLFLFALPPPPFLLPRPCASNNISYFIWLNSAFQICKLRYWLIISLEAISSIQKQFLEKCWRKNDWVYNCISKLLKYESSIDHFRYRNGLFHASQVLKDMHEYHYFSDSRNNSKRGKNQAQCLNTCG